MASVMPIDAAFITAFGIASCVGSLGVIDGHGHSTCSDGRRRIGELLGTDGAGQALILLTDHNTFTHFPRTLRLAMRYAPGRKHVLAPAIEVSCVAHDADLHVICVGGTGTAMEPVIRTLTEYYHERERLRLSAVQERFGVAIDYQLYERFVANRTPNWTLSFRFLSRLVRSGKVPAEVLKAIRRGNEIGTDRLPIGSRPVSLAELLAVVAKSGGVAFLCHVGDVAAHYGTVVVERVLTEHPTLHIDLSARPYHLSHADIVRSSSTLRRRLRNKPALRGSDFHDRPSPQTCPSRLRTLLARTAASRLGDLSAEFLIGHPIFLAPLVELPSLLQDVPFVVPEGETIEQWIDRAFPSKGRRTAEVMLGVALLRDELGRAILIRASREGALRSSASAAAWLRVQPIEKVASQLRDAYATGWLAAMFDVAQRMGFLTILDRIAKPFLAYVPKDLGDLYGTRATQTACARRIQNLAQEAAFDSAGLLIWRRKGLVSVYANLVRLLLSGKPARVGISCHDAARMAGDLLFRREVTDETRSRYYSELLFDHLAATLIIDPATTDIDYSALWDTISVPDVRQVEISPREAYHRRIWLHILKRDDDHVEPLELMIKTRRDFLVGRAVSMARQRVFACSCGITLARRFI
ncbi:MAG TPA: hypothetical protein VNN25_12630 [Thermoanaerobaculia bacterium]|nr:hypothetical protein [Thermoanaerobaculia bacterium]